MECTIQELLKQSIQYLKSFGVENSILDAQLILSHILQVERLYLVTHNDRILDEKIVLKVNQLMELRAQGIPVQHILGKQEFMSLPFKVTKDVLIPRADTEILVEAVINKSTKLIQGSQILGMDIGTGSGCIAISLVHYISNISMYAIDISHKALEIAKENASINGVEERITFIEHDILRGIPKIEGNAILDIIVSNPPYIPTEMIKSLQTEVKEYDPYHALDGGEDGLMFYRMIIEQAKQHLKGGGLLALEVGHDQNGAVRKLIQNTGQYHDIETVKDLAGIDRVILATSRNN